MARQANPQEQKMKNLMVIQALKFLHQPEQAQALENAAKQGDPAEAIATMVATALKGITEAAASKGKNLTAPFILAAAKEIIGELVAMLVEFGVVKKPQAAQVSQQAVQVFTQITGGGQQPQPQQQAQPKPQGLLGMGA